MPALTQLTFTLDVTFPPPKLPLLFSNLNEMTLRSKSLHLISGLLSVMQLPALTDFLSFIRNCPSRHDFTSFLTGVQKSSTYRTIKWLALLQTSFLPSNAVRSEAPLLCLDDLRPCMALNNLRHLELVIEWNVGLTDTELLALASSWPHLETLYINIIWGWNTLGGITPTGLLQLLQTCRALSSFALAVDTRGYTELPPSGPLASLGSRSLPITYINVLDSIIEAEAVPAIAAFFVGIPLSIGYTLCAWSERELVKPPGWEVYKARWDDVNRQVNDAVSRYS